MALDGKILARSLDSYRAGLQRRTRETERLRQTIYSKQPRVEQIDRLLSETVAAAVAAAVSGGGDPREEIEKLRDENLALQAERAELIAELGYPYDCIDDKPFCEECSDHGFIGKKPCSCLMEIYREEQRKELSSLLDLSGENFGSFRLDYYDDTPAEGGGVSPRRHMKMVYTACLRYAESFSPDGENLFFSGGTGLGKTFLSSCIAGAVSEKGYSVVYETAIELISSFERARFDKGEDAEEGEENVRRYLGCDLLIIDDLGTELSTSFAAGALYDVINSRLRSRKNTVISSNLGIDEIRRRYSPQIASRLEGEYENLRFYGRDIRLIKRGL
ncbi:MAG: ATP-binding protein [Oscillospiraceae bacterium]|nr:ATP-binding protein [Oscillospiraceae bacterium]